MILNERESRHEHVLHVARQMMTAARTAPKGKGVDIIEIAMVTDGDINILIVSMWALPSDQLVPRQQTTGWTHGSCSRPD